MSSARPDYAKQTDKCVEFLREFSLDGRQPYMDLLQRVANREAREISIDLEHVLEYTQDDELLNLIQTNAGRYVQVFSEAVDRAMPAPTELHGEEEVFDIIQRQRTETARRNAEAAANDGGGAPPPDAPPPAAAAAAAAFPLGLQRRYELRFKPRDKQAPIKIRDAGASEIGSLISVRGVVTRITEVKPMVTVATYTCDTCGFEVYQEVNGRTFTPIATCPSERCRTNKSNGRVILQTRGSKFVKFQELKLQEMTDECPIGHVPRSLTVHLKGSLTRLATAGDIVTVTGLFLPISYQGFRQIRAGLVADTFVEAMTVLKAKKSYADLAADEETVNRVEAAAADPEIYSKLARSIAPEIYGMDDVKKALILLLVGGTTRSLSGLMRIRGDINICLMGDPGVAKSQLLKYIAKVSPRGVYTTGKGSSGVGLTAAVIRDPLTQEISLEGGALVLADMGVCCIDEFDKMEDQDRTAIHEVMEQQTVSIAKAGIITTLNARTSILAAANPIYGRYNRRLTPAENINLPAALLSRFDLVFLLLDLPDMSRDHMLASHICYVHRTQSAPPLDFLPFDARFLREFVSQARRFEPVVTPAVNEYLVETYVTMRQADEQRKKLHGHTSARTLLGVIRLAQALARLRFDEVVVRADVDEAVRLMNMSKASLEEDSNAAVGVDPKSAIYRIIRDYDAQTLHHAGVVRVADIMPQVLTKGYSEQLLADVLQDYEELNIWHVDEGRNTITFIQS